MSGPGRGILLLIGVLWWAQAPGAAQDRMPANEAVATLRRLYQSGSKAEAEALLDRLATQARGDANYCFAVGMTLGAAGQIGRAEQFLTMAAAAAPADYRILYNLGVAASYSGHFGRAQEVLATALKLQPQNVDVLYNLAYVNEKLGRREETIRLLARAVKLAPQRADLFKLTAIAAFELRAWEDALAAWNSYLKLQPDDDVARRERGFTAVQMGQFEQGIADIRWFLERHPRDAEAYHELGLAEVDIDPVQALAHLDKAIELQPDFAEARSNRGNLSYQQGRPEAALPDLEFAAGRKPDDAITLDRLGQTYLALDRPADAVRVLRRAAGLAPEDGRMLLHLGRALADAGEVEESKGVMERFRQMGPTRNPPVPAGLVDYLGLSPEQQRADYRSRLEKAIAKEPGDAAAQVRYLKFLLDEGNLEQARAAAQRIAALKPNEAVLAEAGRALLSARQFQGARDLLAQAGDGSDVQLDLALATFGVSGGAKGLEELDRVPEPGRTGGVLPGAGADAGRNGQGGRSSRGVAAGARRGAVEPAALRAGGRAAFEERQDRRSAAGIGTCGGGAAGQPRDPAHARHHAGTGREHRGGRTQDQGSAGALARVARRMGGARIDAGVAEALRRCPHGARDGGETGSAQRRDLLLPGRLRAAFLAGADAAGGERNSKGAGGGSGRSLCSGSRRASRETRCEGTRGTAGGTAGGTAAISRPVIQVEAAGGVVDDLAR